MIEFCNKFVFYLFLDKFLYYIKISSKGIKFYNFLNRKWFFDKIYNEIISQNLLETGYKLTYKIIDRGIIELFGPLGLSTIIKKNAKQFSNLQSGYIYHYTLLMLVSIIVIFALREVWLIFGYFMDFRILLLLIFYIIMNIIL